MPRPAIRVEGLGKRYVVNHENRGGGYRTLRESLVDMAAAPLKRLRGERGASREEFWALNDVSFEVQPGEVVGIIGRNGAGKSTLLKILSRITKPTNGRVKLNGRVGSLLEVGTGFHPELTGRENIYLNGSILGMSRREIARKFDEIVDFAEIETFLDTPVKRYSSGMYVRLAFSVAAHLEPEILIIDEVLAVGDATFQRRCIERMSQLARSGCTILFVSHNLEIVPLLCQNAILLSRGNVDYLGSAGDVVHRYLATHMQPELANLRTSSRTGSGQARFVGLKILDCHRNAVYSHVSGEDLIIRMEIESSGDIPSVDLAVVLQNLRGMRLITSWTKEAGFATGLQRGRQFIECHFHNVRLRPGHHFTLSLWMTSQEVLDCVENIISLPVIASPTDEHFSTSGDQGVVLCDHSWFFSTVDDPALA